MPEFSTLGLPDLQEPLPTDGQGGLLVSRKICHLSLVLGLILAVAPGLSFALGWSLPTIAIEAESSSSNVHASSSFTTSFEIHTSVNATQERMYLRSEILVPNLIERLFGTDSDEPECVKPRLIGGNTDARICNIRLLDFGVTSELGEFDVKGAATVVENVAARASKPIEFSIAARTTQVGRTMAIRLEFSYPGSSEELEQSVLPTKANFVYQLEPCFERHELKIDSVNYLRSAGKFAIKSHASTLWMQGALGCQARHASR